MSWRYQEIPMSQHTQVADHAVSGVTYTLGHWFRMLITFCSFGFIYPNSFTEGMDLTGIQNRGAGDLYK